MSLPVREFRAREFRSLKAITYPVSNLDVFVGGNGVGKTNLYRAWSCCSPPNCAR